MRHVRTRPPPDRPAHRQTMMISLTLHTDLLGDLQVPGAAGRGAELEALSVRAAIYATRARGDGTRRVYRSAWRGFETWCRALGCEPLSGDPDLLAMYATRRADDGVAISTLRVDLAAIRTAHLLAGIPLDLRHPRLAMVVEGITRGRGTRPIRQAAPAVPAVLRLLLAACRPADTALGARDRAMLLLGFGAALRRSEMVALQLGDSGAGARARGAPASAPLQNRPARPGPAHSRLGQPGRNPLLCPVIALNAWLTQRARASRR